MTPSAWYLQVANTIQIEKFIEILSKLTRPAGLEEVVEIVCRDLHVWVFRLVRRWTSLLTVQLAEFEIESTYGKAGIHLVGVTKVFLAMGITVALVLFTEVDSLFFEVSILQIVLWWTR